MPGATPIPEAALPAWLDPPAAAAYVPPRDRDAFVRTNLLRIVSTLAAFDMRPHGGCPMARAYARVAAPTRLVGVVALVAMVSAARNMAFVWLVLAGLLACVAMRPAREISALCGPALVLAAISALLMVPAALLGQPGAPVRMAVKSFVTCCLVLGLARSTGAHGLVAAARSLGLPATAALVCDLAIRDLALLGRTAAELSESLACRSVGRNADKTASAAGVMGVTFLKAQGLAQAQAEAMACRGLDAGEAPALAARKRLGAGDVAYALLVVALLATFLWLEGAMA